MEAKKLKIWIVCASLLVGCTYNNSAFAWPQMKEIHVRGRVYCQDCTQGWNEWAKGGRPLKGSKVSIMCMDERSRVIYYGSDTTDEAGQFNMIVNKYINGKGLKEKLCSVRLVSSPDPTCNVATDFDNGCRGVKLSRPTSVYRDVVKYTVGPLYYTSPMCQEPEIDW